MEIQDESPVFPDPLASWESDYGDAVLHLAWNRNSTTTPNERTLLFAFVELLPTEIPAPVDDYDPKSSQCCHQLNNGNHYVYVRHAVTTARKALDWYLKCRQGEVVLPENDGTLPLVASETAKRLAVPPLSEEPTWPTLIAASDDTDTLPFIPQWIDGPRVHHLLPASGLNKGDLWSAGEANAARRWLTERLHFDLDKYPEYWGSIHLIAPNPVYRTLSERLQRRGGPGESVLFRFHPRAGKSVTGLELTFREKDPWGISAFKQTTVRSSILRMNLDREVNSTATDVFDPLRGFLQVGNAPHAFLKRIVTDLHIANKTIVQTDKESFEVMRTGKPEKIQTGPGGGAREARSRMLGAYYSRKQRKAAEDQDQRWFRDQRDDATGLLRSLLNEAGKSVLVVDPYFAAEELAAFTLAVGRYDIPIRILTSAEVLRKTVDKESDLEKGAQLLLTLQNLQQHQKMNPFDIRVMPGARPAVHDRFLLIDKRIWLLGSSLNEFGTRGTMMLGVPDPESVRPDLERAWNESEPLDTWVTLRKQSQQEQES